MIYQILLILLIFIIYYYFYNNTYEQMTNIGNNKSNCKNLSKTVEKDINTIINVNSEMLLALCNSPKQKVCSKKEFLSDLRSKDIDVLLTLGAGDIGDLVEPIKHMLN